MQRPDQVLLLQTDKEVLEKLLINADAQERIMSMGAIYLQVNAWGTSEECPVAGSMRPWGCTHIRKGTSLYLTTTQAWCRAKNCIGNLDAEDIYSCCLKSDGTPDLDEILVRVGGEVIALSCSKDIGKVLSKSQISAMTEMLRMMKRFAPIPVPVTPAPIPTSVNCHEDKVTLVYITSPQDPESRKLVRALNYEAIGDLGRRGVNVISLNVDKVLLLEKDFPSDVIRGIAETFPVLLVTTAHKWLKACKTRGILGSPNLYSQYCQQCEGEDIKISDILEWVEEQEERKKKNYKPQGYKKK